MGSGRGDDPESVVTQFNDCINGRDVDGLARLMTDEHVFIDSAGGRVDGKVRCLAAWGGFFDAYPDYRNVFASISASADQVAVAGRSVCSEPVLNGPALWTARVRDGLVREWRVYEDTPEIRARIGLPRAANRSADSTASRPRRARRRARPRQPAARPGERRGSSCSLPPSWWSRTPTVDSTGLLDRGPQLRMARLTERIERGGFEHCKLAV